MAVVLALGALVLQGCQTTSTYLSSEEEHYNICWKAKQENLCNLEFNQKGIDRNYGLCKGSYHSDIVKRLNLNCNEILGEDNQTLASKSINSPSSKLKFETIKIEDSQDNEDSDENDNTSNLSQTIKPLVIGNSKPSNTCTKLQNKVLQYIDNDNFDKASSARKLMKEMGCSSNANNTSNNSAQNKYTSSELNCNVGPLGKFLWAEYGKYSATAYNDNPPKSCLITYDYCKSRARAIAKGANIPPSEKSPDSYTANCNIYGSGNKSVNCNVRPNSGAGGFTGGLANSLSKGIDEASRKQDIYVSNFELCMSEMGYQLSKR